MSGRLALAISGLSVSFRMYTKGLEQRELRVIDDLNLSLRAGEIVAVVGASGSGKSLLAHAVLGILPQNATVRGEMSWFGEPLTAARQKALRGHELALVPQSVAFLDPLMRVGKQVAGVRVAKGSDGSNGSTGSTDVVKQVFRRYGLAKRVMRLYPFQLSGGMARRVLVSTAVIGGAKVIIADEPTPGLSQELAEATMGHFRELADNGAAIMLITHDIDLALGYADRLTVFYSGVNVETASVADWINGEKTLRHPYSQALWRAMPQNGFQSTPGTPPYAGEKPEGCLYAPRCELADALCCGKAPEMREFRGGEVRCHHAS
jgi:peptide/nickel transport system ATP-binding protein